ncbi:MAG: Fic family protein [Verrucomicrobia bacterium]|nr:Fic family protein [Verrucomicrobiota bacterium]
MALIFASSDPKIGYQQARFVRAGKLRKLAPKIYTDEFASPAEDIIRRNRYEIAAHFYSGAVIGFRTALDGGTVSPGKRFHLSLPRPTISSRPLPGLEIRVWPGPAAQPEDSAITVGTSRLFMAGRARALLENLLPARARGPAGEAKTVSRVELENWLEKQIRLHGAGELTRLLDEAGGVAARLAWPDALAELRQIVTDLEGRGDAGRLHSPLALARAAGEPYDPERGALFSTLQARLAAERFSAAAAPPAAERVNRAFWESYFSNYIEGTKFTVEEAQSIVFAADPKKITQQRPKDAHDIVETFRLIMDDHICREVPADVTGFFDVLKRRHARMMASRPETEPGVFKRKPNQVGSKTLVAPELVQGTLRRAWPMVRELTDPAARALMVHFILAETHPFKDGNGRISRLGLNAELDASQQMRLVMPTSHRGDYLTVLDAMTRGGNPEPYVAFGHRLLQLNAAIPYDSFEQAHAYFLKIGALDETAALGINLAQVASPAR